MVEFVSYDGRFPNLCSGALTLKINGEEIVFSDGVLCSGGNIWFDDEWGEHIEDGPWDVNIPDEYVVYAQEIKEIVNKSVPWGCCGGCL